MPEDGARASDGGIPEDTRPQDPLPEGEPPDHPLIFETERASYDAYAQISAAVGDEAFADAARLIVETEAPGTFGLLPDLQDEQLLLGYAEFVLRCTQLFPAIGDRIRQQDNLGLLRWNKAMADGDLAAAESVAAQFPGTDAAERACRWLGDWRLSEGRFRQAEGWYLAALAAATQDGQEELASRLRLAAGMRGHWLGAPAALPLDYRGMRLSAAELEDFLQTRITELRSRGDSPGGDPAPEVFQAATAIDYQAEAFTETPVSNPAVILRQDPQSEIDWASRATSATVMRDRLIVASRSEVACYKLDAGKQLWQQDFDGLRAFPALWSWTAHRLLCHDERIFVRHLARGTIRLACLEADRGGILWESPSELCVASDPFFADGQIVVLDIDVDDPFRRTAAATNPYRMVRQYSQSARPLQLSLLLLDAQTGEIVDRHLLARFHNGWEVMFPCRATLLADSVIAAAGGVTLRARLDGRLHWVRRHAYRFPEEAATWFAAHHAPPLAHEDRVIVSQPGVAGVQCLDISTGAMLWDQRLADLRRVIGVAAGRVIVQRADGFQAFRLQDGSLQWSHDGVGPTEAVMCGDTSILYADCCARDASDWQVVLRWLDAEQGQVMFESALPGVLADRRITHRAKLGPLVPLEDALLLGADRAQRRSPTRMLYRLEPRREGDIPSRR
jgi:outer membrane protein assembly factor BamB